MDAVGPLPRGRLSIFLPSTVILTANPSTIRAPTGEPSELGNELANNGGVAQSR